MSRELVLKIRDDMDKEADAQHTIKVTVEGTEYDGTYVMDLCEKNAQDFEKKVRPYLEAAHEQIGPKGRVVKNGKTARDKRKENELIRRWARSQGFQIGDKGQIPAEIKQAFERFDPSVETPKEAAARNGKKGGEIARLRALPKELRDEIRSWAQREGIEVSARGFLGADVVKAFEAAHKVRVSA